jgi:hypothetical protein
MKSESLKVANYRYVGIVVAKAQPTVKDEPVVDASIVIDQQMPEFTDLDRAAAFYEEQAQMIEHLLYKTLPGGTYDRLAVAMLRRKASHFRVAYGE